VANAGRAVNKTLLKTVNRDVILVHKNQRDLENQTKLLEIETDRFMKQTQRWLGTYKDLNRSLEQIGDIENWAKQIDENLSLVTEALEAISSIEERM